MRDELKNKVIVILFAVIIFGVFIVNILIPDKDISYTERRKLNKFPEVTLTSVINGNFADKFEDYAADQFVARDGFRNIKYFVNTNVYMQKDTNKLFVKDNAIYKMEYPLNEKNVASSASKIKYVLDKYLQNNKIYYSIIPEKSYYLQDDHLKIGYDKVESIMKAKLTDAKYIDIKDVLNLEDYYRTDIHWKQENILEVANRIKENMNLSQNQSYDKKEVGKFSGSYYGQVGVTVPQDTLTYVTSDVIQNATTYNYETQKVTTVYDFAKYEASQDKYDIFVSGPTPIITIENNKAGNNKELLIFRDSFGSSLAPYFIENYNKVTLIDLRYITGDMLDKYITFGEQDVLIIYSSTVLNQNILR